MKSKLSFLLLGYFVLLLISELNFSQSNQENSVDSVLKNIFDYSINKSYDKAALLIAYNGDDKSRSGTDTFNPTDVKELDQVKRICKKISALIDISDQYSINKIEATKIGDVDGYKLIVDFKSGNQKLETVFEFMKLSKGFTLLNVN